MMAKRRDRNARTATAVEPASFRALGFGQEQLSHLELGCPRLVQRRITFLATKACGPQ